MSFGRFVCIYGIGYAVSVVVSKCDAIAWLVLRVSCSVFDDLSRLYVEP